MALQVKDLLQRLQDEMMPAPPPQVGSNVSAATFVQQGVLCHTPATPAVGSSSSYVDPARSADAADVCPSAMLSGHECFWTMLSSSAIDAAAAVEDMPDGMSCPDGATAGERIARLPDGQQLLVDDSPACVQSSRSMICHHSQGDHCACGSESACGARDDTTGEAATGDGATAGERIARFPDGQQLLVEDSPACVQSSRPMICHHSQGDHCACGSESACGARDDTTEEAAAGVDRSWETTMTNATSHMAKRTRHDTS